MSSLNDLNAFIKDFEDKLTNLYSDMRKNITEEIYKRKEYKEQYNAKLKKLYEDTTNEKFGTMIKANLPLINKIFRTNITVTGKCLEYENSVITVYYYYNKNSCSRFNYSFHESDFNK